MKRSGLSDGRSWRLLGGAVVVAITAGVSGVALGAGSNGTTVIRGCVNSKSGALRVLTSHNGSCGSERKISWNKTGPTGKTGPAGRTGGAGRTGPAGNGYAFSRTTGTSNKFGVAELDGPVLTKAGTYFVNVTAKLNIAAYTSGGSGLCALDLATKTPKLTYVFEIFSEWGYPEAADNIENLYPFGSSGMIRVLASQTHDQLILSCDDNSFVSVPVASGTWLVSPVSAASSGTATASVAHSTLGPAGFRSKPARRH